MVYCMCIYAYIVLCILYVYNVSNQSKFHGGNSELRTFTFSLAQRSLYPVGWALSDHEITFSRAEISLCPVGTSRHTH